jgi:short subunit dehydrogenase-like uncharacterized protein
MVEAGKTLLVYGANGYTARLLMPRLRALGLKMIAAGRDGIAVRAVAEEHDAEARVFSLSDPQTVDSNLAGASALLNAAGPFSSTAQALIDACLRQRIDYLDLSGEIEPLSYAARCHEFARRLGVMLLPAIGFDVVPSDCLAAHLSELLPGADRLTLCISASNLLSRGSAATLIEQAGTHVYVRHAGVLEAVRFRVQARWVDFGAGERATIAVSWGDLVTAFHTTRIPNISVYFEATAFRWLAVTANQVWGPALQSRAARAPLESLARSLPVGPSALERASERSVIVGEVERDGERVRSRLLTPEAYTFTAEAAARVVRAVFDGTRVAGFQTPGKLLGPDFVLGIPGVRREALA